MVTFGTVVAGFGGPGTSTIPLRGVSSSTDPQPGTLSFMRAWGESSRDVVETHDQTLFLVPQDAPDDLPQDRVVRVEGPRLAYAQAVRTYLAPPPPAGVSPHAVVGDGVQLGKDVSIGHFSVIEEGVVIGDGTVIDSHVVLKKGVVIGARCRVGAHTVIGTAGFGYEFDDSGRPILIPHLGGVQIGDDVEIGNQVSIAQGTIDPTVIRNDVKIDDCVFIAHNCFVDEASYLIAGAEISGSVTIGKRVWVSPEATVINKVSIGDDALVGIGAVVTRNVPANSVVSGVPAKVLRDRYDDPSRPSGSVR
jgi:UDP-3-O-[3-hydroxymyristoyl] glucosamine N-acyltransferase